MASASALVRDNRSVKSRLRSAPPHFSIESLHCSRHPACHYLAIPCQTAMRYLSSSRSMTRSGYVTSQGFAPDTKMLAEHFDRAHVRLRVGMHRPAFLQHLAGRNLTRVSRSRKLAAIRKFFVFLHENGSIQTNPAAAVRGARRERRKSRRSSLSAPLRGLRKSPATTRSS